MLKNKSLPCIALAIIAIDLLANGFSQINEFKFPQETTYSSQAFIIPNEPNAYFFAEPLNEIVDPEGILVVVGTLRGLIDFGFGNFKYAIFLDINEYAIKFNQALFEAVKEINNDQDLENEREKRMRFIDLITGKFSTIDVIRNFVNNNDNISDIALMKEWLSNKKNKVIIDEKNNKIVFKRISEKDKDEENNTVPQTYQNILIKLATFKYFDPLFYYDMGDALNNFYLDETRSTQYFWESDQQWRKIAFAIGDGRLATMGGSILEEESAKVVKEFVDKSNSYVATLDISNIPGYSSVNKDELIKWIETFNNEDKKQIILFTASLTGKIKHQEINNFCKNSSEKWTYCSLPYNMAKLLKKTFK